MTGMELRTRREAMQMTQEALGKRLGVGKARVSQVESSPEAIDPAWALAVEQIGLSERRLPPLEYLIQVAMLVDTASSADDAVALLVERMPGLAPLATDDHQTAAAAEPIRAAYVADLVTSLRQDMIHGGSSDSTRELIELAAANTDAGFWIVTRGSEWIHRYLRGERDLAAELPEIVSMTKRVETEIGEFGLVTRHIEWDVVVRGYGRNHGLDVETTLTYRDIRDEALVRAYVYASHFDDRRSYAAGD